MRISMGARVVLIVVAVVVGLTALVAYALGREYGGNEATEGLAKGYLPDDLVEVRSVDWGLGADASRDYELAVEGEIAVIRLVEGDGMTLFTGSADEAGSWLDEQGPQQFLGSAADADAHLSDLRDDATSYTGAIILGLTAIGLLIVALIPNRRTHEPPGASPSTSSLPSGYGSS
jgi:hypothetical protein